MQNIEMTNSLKMFQCLEHAYTQTKYFHQRTSSYAEHMALGGFYEALSPLADEFIETFMGIYGDKEGCNDDFTLQFKAYKEGISTEYMNFFHNKLMEYSEEIKESCLKNIIDEIMALTAKTIYLLTLKK